MTVNVPETADAEKFAARIHARIDEAEFVPHSLQECKRRDEDYVLIRLALDGLRRHFPVIEPGPQCECCIEAWPCPDGLAWWSVLTGIGETYRVTL